MKSLCLLPPSGLYEILFWLGATKFTLGLPSETEPSPGFSGIFYFTEYCVWVEEYPEESQYYFIVYYVSCCVCYWF
jgi:hypothetical protein